MTSIVSFFTVSGGVVTGRYPLADGEIGWSWSQHKAGYGVRNQVSKQHTAFIESRMDNTAPDVSVSLVEIFYNYPQTLRMPILLEFIPTPFRSTRMPSCRSRTCHHHLRRVNLGKRRGSPGAT